MKPVALGVIGCGRIGRIHVKAAKQSALIDVVAVADLREDAARAVATEFGVGTVYTSADALLADARVEAVVLALPTAGRTEIALRAFATGKHVLVEKPVAMNANEVRAMIAGRGDLVAACCSSRNRCLPSSEVAAAFVATGALGDLRVIHCRAIDGADEARTAMPPAWRLIKALNGGGILMNWGCYDLDYLLGITGWTVRPRLVLGQVWPVPPMFASHIAPGSDAETHVAALIRCDNGIVISYERAEYATATTEDAWKIIGSKGSLRLWMLPEKNKTITFDSASTEHGVVSRTLWSGDEDGMQYHAGPVCDFAAAIREHRPPKTTLEQALIVQQITDAIYASAERGAAVEIV